MIIYDDINQKELMHAILLLTPKEARELLGALEQLTTKPGDHYHLNNEAYSKEITIALYTPDNRKSFAKIFQEMIEDELLAAA